MQDTSQLSGRFRNYLYLAKYERECCSRGGVGCRTNRFLDRSGFRNYRATLPRLLHFLVGSPINELHLQRYSPPRRAPLFVPSYCSMSRAATNWRAGRQPSSRNRSSSFSRSRRKSCELSAQIILHLRRSQTDRPSAPLLDSYNIFAVLATVLIKILIHEAFKLSIFFIRLKYFLSF